MAMGKMCTTVDEVKSTTKALEMAKTDGARKTGGATFKEPKKGKKS